MVITRWTADNNPRVAGWSGRSGEQGVQASQRERRREMLLLHGDVSFIPTVADLDQPLLQQLEANYFRGVVGERLREDNLRLVLVKLHACVDPGVSQFDDSVP